jgi:hypothetical protein
LSSDDTNAESKGFIAAAKARKRLYYPKIVKAIIARACFPTFEQKNASDRWQDSALTGNIRSN